MKEKQFSQSEIQFNDAVDKWLKIVETGINIELNVYPTGVSMLPLIRGNRDKVTVCPLKREVRRGDIVLFFRADGKKVMHRVWKIDGNVITTYGDGCYYPDKPINVHNILGIATVLHRRKGAKDGLYREIPLNNAFRRKLGLLWLSLGPARRFFYRVRGRMLRIKKHFRQKKNI